MGIKSQYLERIFEVFRRLQTRREFPGTGIGLAICKKNRRAAWSSHLG
ncbi:hypothetical protein [Nostoc sp.]